MSSIFDNAIGEGNSQWNPREQSPAKDMEANPPTKVTVPTTVTAEDVPGNREASGSSAMEKDDESRDGLDTPRNQDTDLRLLECQLQEMQTRLKELEKQNQTETREPATLETNLTAELFTSQNESQAQDLNPRAPSTEEVRGWIETKDELRDRLFSRDLSEDNWAGYVGGAWNMRSIRAMHTLERSLLSLQIQHEKQRQILDERDDFYVKKEDLEREHRKLLRRLEGRTKRRSHTNIHIKHSSDSPGTTEATGEEEEPPVGLEKAELNEIGWGEFIRSPRKGPESYAIDVLKGDPIITWNQRYIGRVKSRQVSGYPLGTEEKLKPRKPVADSKPPPIPGYAPLPERIRINSKHILRMLEDISGTQFENDEPVVMIRPYKALVYYDEVIRSKFQKLEAKFDNNEILEGGITGDPPEQIYAGNDLGTPGPEGTETTGADEGNGTGTERVERSNEAVEADDDNESTETDDEDEFTSSPTAYQHLKCLVYFMDAQIRTKLGYLRSSRCQSISFTDVWYLFRPGDEVIEPLQRQVYRVISIETGPHRTIAPWMILWGSNDVSQEDATVVLKCVHIDFDGRQLGPKVRKVRIAKFDGEKAVTALEVYPLYFAEERNTAKKQIKVVGSKPEEPTLREKMIARGELFMSMTSFKHMHYSGFTLDTLDEVDGHVVVDFEEAFSHAPKKNADSSQQDESEHQGPKSAEQYWRPELDNLLSPQLVERFGPGRCNAACCLPAHGRVYDDSSVEQERNKEYMDTLIPQDRQQEPPPTLYPRLLSELKVQENALSEEDLLIMSYRVFGFILRNRKWAQLDLDYLVWPEEAVTNDRLNRGTGEVHLDSGVYRTTADSTKEVDDKTDLAIQEDEQTAFGQLVLPPGHKNMVKSLVAQHFRDKDSASKEPKKTQQVDIVRGKGKGLIILLHGAPGVGKTTTAEGVAEMFKKPLFQMTCGDLGTTAPEVEKSLETHFALASRWGCILLLDEADVFLASRSKEDFKRNGLVSVFLRVLEYYTGILFLTTNRVGDFDEAFASRIHISLYYPHLTLDNTQAIFKLNLNIIEKRFRQKGRKIKIEEGKILDFAKAYFDDNREERWNGRQIRNACQTALALAEDRAQGGNYSHGLELDAVVELKVEDLKVVSNAYQEFMKYLNTVRGKDAEMYAKGLKLRAREIDVLLYGGSGEKNNDRDIEKNNREGVQKYGQYETVPMTTADQHMPEQVDNTPSTTGLAPQASATTPQPYSPGPAYGPPPSAPGVPPGFPSQGNYPQWPYGGYPPGAYAPPPNPQGAPAQAGQQQWASPYGGWYPPQQQQTTQQGAAPGGAPGYGMPAGGSTGGTG